MDSDSFSRWVRESRLSLGWTQQQLADRAGLSGSLIWQLEDGRRDESRVAPRTLSRLRQAFEEAKETSQRHSLHGVIQVLGSSRAGNIDDIVFDGAVVGVIPSGGPFSIRDPEAFGLIVSGDSMLPRVGNGDVVILSPSADLSSGDLTDGLVCFVQFDGSRNSGGTIKRVYAAGGTHYKLVADNPNWQPQVQTVEVAHVARILPVVAHWKVGRL